jgi:hypothetical protein
MMKKVLNGNFLQVLKEKTTSLSYGKTETLDLFEVIKFSFTK